MLCMTAFNFVFIVSLQRPLKVIIITQQLQGVRSVLYCFLSSAFFLGDSWQWYKFMDSNVSFQYMHINVMMQSICWFFRMIRGRLPQKGRWQRWTKKECSKDVTISRHCMSAAGLHFWWMGAFSYSAWDKQDSSGCQHLTNGANQGSAHGLPYPEDFCVSTSQSGHDRAETWGEGVLEGSGSPASETSGSGRR